MGDSPLFYFVMKESVLQRDIYKLISPEIAVMGFELIELDFSGGVLRLTIDKPGGVTLDDCVSVNRRVSLLLDNRDPIEGSYRLEVSSPGLNRRLKTPGEFEHFAGRKAKVQTKEGVYRGVIKGLAGECILLDVSGTEVKVPFEDIQKANLEFEF